MTQGKKIETITLEELFKESTSGSIPILVDIQHDNITWREGDEQENGHLRLINDSVSVKFQGKKYLPSVFTFSAPSSDGKKVGNASITVSAIDKRIIEVIRGINDFPPTIKIEAFFAKCQIETQEAYVFSRLYSYEFEMSSASWNAVSAKWELTYDTTMTMNVPVDEADRLRCPAAEETQ